MDYITLTIGLCTAFLLGAYIREPFPIIKHKEPKKEPEKVIEELITDQRTEQLLNMWNYSERDALDGRFKEEE